MMADDAMTGQYVLSRTLFPGSRTPSASREPGNTRSSMQMQVQRCKNWKEKIYADLTAAYASTFVSQTFLPLIQVLWG